MISGPPALLEQIKALQISQAFPELTKRTPKKKGKKS